MRYSILNCVFSKYVPAPEKAIRNVRELNAGDWESMVYDESTGELHVKSAQGEYVYPSSQIARLVVKPSEAPKKAKVRKKRS